MDVLSAIGILLVISAVAETTLNSMVCGNLNANIVWNQYRKNV